MNARHLRVELCTYMHIIVFVIVHSGECNATSNLGLALWTHMFAT